MKRFVFPLKAVMSVRAAACNTAKHAYAKEVARTHQARETLQSCNAAINRAQEAQTQALTEGKMLDTQALVRTAQFLEAEQKKRVVAQYQYRECLEAQRQALMSFWKKKQALKNLEDFKQRQAHQYLNEQLRYEEQELQELFLKNQY